MKGLLPIVTAKIAGQTEPFLLDSGAFYSSIDAKLATDQKFKAAPTDRIGTRLGAAAAVTTSGVAGQYRVDVAVIAPTFEFAGSSFKDVVFMTLDHFNNFNGILGQNVLQRIDNEYDLSNGLLRLVQPQDCKAAPMAYWAKPGDTYSVLPLDRIRNDPHTRATVTINGVKMRAIFDTGAGTSFITERAAGRAGVKVSDAGVKSNGSTRGIDRSPVPTWIAPFSNVKIGDEEIKNTLLEIGATSADAFDVLIGADFFLAHHIYVANSQDKIYFTYSGGPVFSVRPTLEAEAKP
jgi:hypothetical protein